MPPSANDLRPPGCRVDVPERRDMTARDGRNQGPHDQLGPSAVSGVVLGRAVPGPDPIDVQVVNGQGLGLEGHALIPIEVGHSDSDDTTVLWVPSLKLAVTGDVVYNGVHLALTEPGSRGRPKYVIRSPPWAWTWCRPRWG